VDLEEYIKRPEQRCLFNLKGGAAFDIEERITV
jgi:hypothetical protein